MRAKLIIGAVVVVGLFGLTYWSMGRLNSQDAAAAPGLAGAGISKAIELPNGSIITVVPGSIGERLARYLASDAAAPQAFRLAGGEFNRLSDTATPATRGTLAELVLLINAYPKAQVRIVGYTDDVGTAEANLALSDARARAVMEQLITGGVNAARLSSVGMGSTNPIGDNATLAGKALNRRIEIEITSKDNS